MDSNAISILQNLVAIAWIDVAFLLDAKGQLLASVGSSPSFDPSGSFSVDTPEPTDDPEDSLYITAITRDIYLGVLFPASTPVEDVRVEVQSVENSLAAVIAEE